MRRLHRAVPGLLVRAPLVILLVVSASGLVGCAAPTNLEGTDALVFQPAARLTWQVSPRDDEGESGRGDGDGGSLAAGGDLRANGAAERRADSVSSFDGGRAPSRAPGVESGGTLAVDADFSFAQADLSQTLDAPDRIKVGDTSLNGPGRISTELRLYAGSIAARGGWRDASGFRLEGFGGLGANVIDLEVERRQDGAKAHDERIYAGPLLGARVGWDAPAEVGLGVYSQAQILLGIGDEAVAANSALELGLSWMPPWHVGLFAAWRWLFLRDDGGESDLRIDLSGPVAGIQVAF